MGGGAATAALRPAVDLAVVGAGVIGLAAAASAVARGARVLVLERERHGAAQSAGPGRIFRHVHDTAALVALAVRARTAWREEEARLGQRLLGEEGTLLVGMADAHAARLSAAGVACEALDAAGVASAMPELAPGMGEGLWDPGGGVIDAEGYVAALAGGLGGAVVRQEARAIRADGDGVLVTTGVGEERAARVLVAAGAGAPALAAGLGVDLPLTTTVHHRVAFAPGPGGRTPGACLLERSERLTPRCYALPLPRGGFAIGVGAHDDRTEEEARAATAAHAARLLPGLAGQPVGVVRCVSTVLAGHPEHVGLYPTAVPGASVLAGGNLFKFAPALGPLLAGALLEGRRHPVLAPPGRATTGRTSVG